MHPLESKFIVNSTRGPTGKRHTGYEILNIQTREVAATYSIRAHGYWRWAQTKAVAECDRLNRAQEG